MSKSKTLGSGLELASPSKHILGPLCPSPRFRFQGEFVSNPIVFLAHCVPVLGLRLGLGCRVSLCPNTFVYFSLRLGLGCRVSLCPNTFVYFGLRLGLGCRVSLCPNTFVYFGLRLGLGCGVSLCPNTFVC